ncbi:putative ribonuclease H-like domain-containing protein [Tanacetum coccineum]
MRSESDSNVELKEESHQSGTARNYCLNGLFQKIIPDVFMAYDDAKRSGHPSRHCFGAKPLSSSIKAKPQLRKLSILYHFLSKHTTPATPVLLMKILHSFQPQLLMMWIFYLRPNQIDDLDLEEMDINWQIAMTGHKELKDIEQDDRQHGPKRSAKIKFKGSTSRKAGLGYGIQSNAEVLGYEEEISRVLKFKISLALKLGLVVLDLILASNMLILENTAHKSHKYLIVKGKMVTAVRTSQWSTRQTQAVRPGAHLEKIIKQSQVGSITFREVKGIKQEFSNARTPQQNGVAERINRTLIEAARTMLADSHLPTTFWAEAVNIACYTFNRVRVTKPQNKTPYELLFGHKPILSYIRPFGCHVTILNTLSPLAKFDGKSDEGFLVGYSINSKAFRVYNFRVFNFMNTKIHIDNESTICIVKNPVYHSGSSDSTHLYSNPNTDPNRMPLTKAKGQSRFQRSINLNTAFKEVNSGNIEAISPSADHEEDVFSDADDDEMPEIRIYDKSSEGIFEKASYDDEGIISGFNNLPDEVYVPTNPSLVATLPLALILSFPWKRL